MRFAIVLLVLLAIACILGSIIPQAQSFDIYAARYSERAAEILFVFYLDDVFHSWWFIGLTGLLCLNLLSCNLVRAKAIFHRFQSDKDISRTLETTPQLETEVDGDPESVFRKLRIQVFKRETLPDGREALLGSKNRIGYWGAWLCHLGMLVLIFGFALGQMNAEQFTVAGFPDDEIVQQDTGNGAMSIKIKDFTVRYNPDGSPKQYITRILLQTDAKRAEGEASVNHPARLFGYLFSQNSYGHAAEVHIHRSGKIIETQRMMPQSAFIPEAHPDVTVFLENVLPSSDAYTGFRYSSYLMGGMMGSREGQVILAGEEQPLIGDLSISFTPTAYTVLIARRDVFRLPTLIGALTVLLGLLISFYFRPVKLLALKNADGIWTLRGCCRKGDAVFTERLQRAAGKEGEQNV